METAKKDTRVKEAALSITCHHLDKWEYMNLDLVEEALEKHGKCCVFIGGASSSGKSFCAKNLRRILEDTGRKAVVISTDSYNKGITKIITDKVEKKDFAGLLPLKDVILKIATPILIDTAFEKKFSPECCARIGEALKGHVPQAIIKKYLECAEREIKSLNFDEPDVYDLDNVAEDLKNLLAGKQVSRKKYSKVISEQVEPTEFIDGSEYSVFIVEGLYVLSNHLLRQLNRNAIVTNFVEGSPKSLFLRRIIRDAKVTSSPTYFTIQMYFSNIVKSYNETILPSSKNADIIFKNDMSFSELREGNLYKTKEKVLVTNPGFIASIFHDSEELSCVYQKDLYLKGADEPSDFNNLLRLREISSDEGKTYVPSSLVHKGAPKTRKDGLEIRPINILLREGEFSKAFSSEKDFLKKMKDAGFSIDRVVVKQKRKISYKGYVLTVSGFKREGIWMEFSDPNMPQEMRQLMKQEATLA